jgi:hypothetical protein
MTILGPAAGQLWNSVELRTYLNENAISDEEIISVVAVIAFIDRDAPIPGDHLLRRRRLCPHHAAVINAGNTMRQREMRLCPLHLPFAEQEQAIYQNLFERTPTHSLAN